MLGFSAHREPAQRTGSEAKRSAASGGEVKQDDEEMRVQDEVGGDDVQEGQAPRLLHDPGQPTAQE